jgi:2,4-dienoyl-CoA reductase-like NADH-dependent reductase (Old Yellow Enzyme family)
MGHGYLLSQFLSPFTNKRSDKYRGDIHGRCHYPLEVVEATRKAVGDRYPILCKINLDDGFQGGLTLDDTIIFAQELEQAGVDTLMNEGFDMVAIGRALIHDPDFILKLKEDLKHVSPCNHCNICVAEMDRGGVRCVLKS